MSPLDFFPKPTCVPRLLKSCLRNGEVYAWKADFSGELTPTEARAEASRLLDFFGKMEEALRAHDAKAHAEEIANNPTGLVALRAAWEKRSHH